MEIIWPFDGEKAAVLPMDSPHSRVVTVKEEERRQRECMASPRNPKDDTLDKSEMERSLEV